MVKEPTMQAAPGYYGAPGPQPDARPRIGEWLSEAFTLFTRDWVTWILMSLIYMAVIMVPAFLFFPVLFTGMMAVGLTTMGPDGQPRAETSVVMAAAMILGVFFFVLLLMVIASYFYTGMIKAAIRQLRGEKLVVGDLFSGKEVWFPAMLSDLVRGLATSVASLFCFVPGYYVAASLMFAHPLVVERRLAPMDALRVSWDTVKPHVWSYLLWLLLIGLIAGLAGFITMPLAFLMIMVAYRDAFGLPGAVPTTTQGIPGQPYGYGAPVPPQTPPGPPYGGQPNPYAPPPPSPPTYPPRP
jgi:hypothetical protein